VAVPGVYSPTGAGTCSCLPHDDDRSQSTPRFVTGRTERSSVHDTRGEIAGRLRVGTAVKDQNLDARTCTHSGTSTATTSTGSLPTTFSGRHPSRPGMYENIRILDAG